MPLETRAIKNSFAREVLGLRLWELPDAQTVDQLRDLWARHPVLVVRRQALSERELANFSALFGPLERVVRTEWASPVVPEIGLISNLKDGQARPIGGLGRRRVAMAFRPVLYDEPGDRRDALRGRAAA